MMAGNPNWWSIMNGMHPHDHHQQQQQQLSNSNSSTNPQFNHAYGSSPSNPDLHLQDNHFPPVRSWSQLLLGGIGGGVGEEEERYSAGLFQQQKKLENWEDQVLNLNPSFTNRISHATNPVADVKQEVSQSITCQLYGNHNLDLHNQDHHDQFHHPNINRPSNSWTSTTPHHTQVIPIVSSPTSCITTLSNTNSFLNFSGSNPTATIEVKSNQHERHQENVSEVN